MRRLLLVAALVALGAACAPVPITGRIGSPEDRAKPWRVTLHDGTCFVTDFDDATAILDEAPGSMVSARSCADD